MSRPARLQRKPEQAQHRKFTYPNSADFPIFNPGKAKYAGGSLIIKTETMPQPRKRLVSTKITPFYHLISRCVRRHFLCGVDPWTGKDYSARKQDIKDRLALLAEVFTIDVCAYAILSNHAHLVVHVDEQTALEWSPLEVAQRWTRLFTGPVLVRAFVAAQKLTETQQIVVHKHIQDYRKRLCSLSWFMKCLNEPIARQANQEDNVTGHFWQARFSSQALLDEAAVLAAMAYVDLNPIRASIAETPETSDFTSVQQRIGKWKTRQNTTADDEATPVGNDKTSLDATIVKLMGFSDGSKEDVENAIPYSTTDYLELVDWSGRAIIEGKKGFIPEQLPPILQRLKLDPAQYLNYVKKPRFGFTSALGALDKIKEYAEHFEKAFLKGQTAAAA
ncbi:MAG: transposase [Wenzhouxiangellaceae bacterium]